MLESKREGGADEAVRERRKKGPPSHSPEGCRNSPLPEEEKKENLFRETAASPQIGEGERSSLFFYEGKGGGKRRCPKMRQVYSYKGKRGRSRGRGRADSLFSPCCVDFEA